MTHTTGMIFHALFRAHHNAALASLTKHGLGDLGSPRLLLELRTCQEHGKFPSQRELADLLHVSPATIATSLKSLERNGYVERHVDPNDSRRNRIALTVKAMDAMEASHEVFLQVDDAMLSGFSQEEIAALKQYLSRMMENLYAIGGEQAPEQPLFPHATSRERMNKLP